MIEIGEKCESGILTVKSEGKHLGDIVKTATKMWLAIPHRQRVLMSAHKLRRDAISALRA